MCRLLLFTLFCQLLDSLLFVELAYKQVAVLLRNYAIVETYEYHLLAILGVDNAVV